MGGVILKTGWNFLNSKQIKVLKQKLKGQFGFESPLDYAFLKNAKNKVFIINRDIERVDFEKLRINSTGTYFCEEKDTEVRMSIEGSQIIGPNSTKNVIDLDQKQQRQWLKGEDLEYPGTSPGFVILRCEDDFLGCAKHKQDKLFNYVPKERRIRSSD